MSGDDHGTPGFEETYRAHRWALVRLAFLMCGSRDLSEDLVQTVFTSAHPRWHTIEHHLAYLKRGVVNLAKDGQLVAYKHDAFWKPMDTLRDKQQLEAMWKAGNAPWKVW